MSCPRGVRIGEANPAAFTIPANRSNAALPLGSNVDPGHGLNGIRFTFAGSPAISRTSSRASASESLTPLQHNVFEGDPPSIGGTGIAAAGGEDLGDRILAVQRHQFIAQVVADGVQRDRKIDAQFRPGAIHHRHHAGGGQGDPPARQADPLAVHDDLHRLGNVGVVVQRLAHAHQHDGRQQPRRLAFRRRPLTVGIPGGHELADDLRRAEVAHQRLGTGMAKPAGQGAADLRRNTDRAAILDRIGDIDGLGFLPVAEAEQPLAGLVDRGLHHRRVWPADHEPLRQPGLQRLGDGGHAAKISHALVVDPVPQLLDAERRLADRRHLGAQFRPVHADQVAPPIRQRYVRWIEQRRLRQNPDAIGLREIAHLGGHAFTIALYASPKPLRLNVSVTSFGAGERAMARLPLPKAVTAALPSRAKALRPAV